MVGAWHFVGFRGDEYARACAVFGKPDFVHNAWDKRAVAEVCAGDVVLLGPKGFTNHIEQYTYDDSSKF